MISRPARFLAPLLVPVLAALLAVGLAGGSPAGIAAGFPAGVTAGFARGALVESTPQHQGHDMRGAPPRDELAWRMPPMDPSMPMMPGLESSLPPVNPYVPAFGVDPAIFPEARPSEIVPLEDGDVFELRAGIVRRTIGNETTGRHTLALYGYNGQYPGPLLKAPVGSTVTVHFRNEIEWPTTVHWHGMRLDNRFDGVAGLTQDPVAVGESFTYEVRFADTGVYWYHPHMREDVQQDLGLYGNLLAVPERDGYYGPVHREEMLVLDDILMDEHGLIPWGEDDPTHALMGRFGNVMLVNGGTDWSLDLKRGEVVRFYVTNVASSRTFNVTFGGAPIKVVASDVSRFERETRVDSLLVAPAERYIVEVMFDDPGEVPVENTIQAIDHFRGEFYPHVDHLGTVTVSEEPVEEDLSDSFGRLREHDDVQADVEAYREHFSRPPDRRLELRLRVQDLPLPIMQSMEFERGLYVPPMEFNDTMPMMNWLSTGKQVEWVLHDPDSGRDNMDIRWRFEPGDAVKIRIFNDPTSLHPMHHPIHVHGQRYLVLEIDGVPNDNLVWKDTAVVPVGSTVDLLVDMSNPGDWMLHCHIAEHLHSGMMLAFRVEE